MHQRDERKLKGLKEFDNIKLKHNIFELSEQIRAVTFQFEEQRHPFASVCFTNRKFCDWKQSEKDTNTKHHEKLSNSAASVESHGGELGHEKTLLEADEEHEKSDEDEKKPPENITKAQENNKQKF